MKYDRYMELAREEALKACHTKFRHGCVLIKNGKVIGTGNNTDTNRLKWRTIHAEEAVIRANQRYCYGATLIVARIKADCSFGFSLPCARCQRMIEKYGIARTYYTTC